MLNLVGRYILRTSTVAFVAALVVLTAVIWLTQALREFDLLTMQGQSILIFLTVTGLAIPSLVMFIAPIALFIAILYVLNRLNADSELIVMSAAGLSPARLMRPFAVLTMVTTLMVGFMSLYAVPAGFHELRDLVTKVRADFITRIVREGTFTTLDQGFVFHYRERGANGALLGIFIQDRRDPTHIATYLAESGTTQQSGDESYLVLQKGSLQREDPKTTSAAIVVFDSYKIDLTQFGGNNGAVPYKPRERSTLDLLTLNTKDPYVASQLGRFRSELHDRFVNPLYALTFGMIALAALAQPRTTRQGRSGAILAAIVIVLLVRVAGFGAASLVVKSAGAVALDYAVPLLGLVGAAWWMFGPTLQRPARRRRLATAVHP
ncbi:LPS export ABC transporter permease LptF [Lichenihabitans sp. PAMC28606]|uniref:LPS export ABC transporter permease LptF n=1 Tax=Lichenihabitans sp. PAMC28606 TaxID=2880932 RepID=UPI001D0A9288|nr:LPS export ABC transporter permease LptF [Lichenihabitans sp. PAMC28606]UDL95224.1 LPS export ABC transporter permease LptF [Lichenihabitans sp. PAMC28606]